MFRSFYVGNSTVGVAVKMGTHVSENNVWHVWLGVYPSVRDSPLVISPEGCLQHFVEATPLFVSRSMSLGSSIGRLLFFKKIQTEKV